MVIRSHGWHQLAPFRCDDSFTWLANTVRLSTGRILDVVIQPAAEGVTVQVNHELLAEEQAELHAAVKWMLGLEMDFSSFYALARQEPKLQRLAESARGRILRSPTLFEDVVKTILTTNTIWSGTIRMNRALVELYGSAVDSDPTRRAFPAPEQIAGVDVDQLRKEARLGYRAPYVLELAQAVADGRLDLEALKDSELPSPELRKRLLGIKGVGNYAAANLLMILGHYDAIPVDSWALKMVSQEWYNGAPIGPPEVEAAFEHWGVWKGLAYWMWDWSTSG
jgi:3-methyladenine DNA glycosylase/8-oxoguanine DNA glycosylase